MKHIPLITIIISAGTIGCQLENPLDVGDSCANIQYVALEQGQHCNRGDCEDYQAYMEANYCPHNYPLCRIDENRDAYCHKTCDTNQIVCNGSCIDPKTSAMHCGARGLCNSDDSESTDFEGIQCPSGYKCIEDGQRARCELSCDSTKVKCMTGDGNYECRDPKSTASCGVRGECSSSDPNSQDFIGESCLSGQSCLKDDRENYHCVCDQSFVVCRIDGEAKCIDPKTENYCGARGACTSDDERSKDFRGKVCTGGQQCVYDNDSGNYDCKCTNGTVFCNDNGQMKCVDPSDSQYCGARGNCNSKDVNSPDYKGMACVEGQTCHAIAAKGQFNCACPEGEIVCKDNGTLKCVDPTESPFCGARGLCNDPDSSTGNYMGKACVDTQTCSDRSGMYDCHCPVKTILCDERCVSPQGKDYCGAKGYCNSSDENDKNYRGKKCRENESCILKDGKYVCSNCDIASGDYIFCNGNCTHIAEDKSNCGSCGYPCPSMEPFRDNAPVFSACENKSCCYRGGLAKEYNDKIGDIRCCAGTYKYKYVYDAGKSCLKGTHYGCYAADELPFKRICWVQVK